MNSIESIGKFLLIVGVIFIIVGVFDVDSQMFKIQGPKMTLLLLFVSSNSTISLFGSTIMVIPVTFPRF